jgi:hypothetical protein
MTYGFALQPTQACSSRQWGGMDMGQMPVGRVAQSIHVANNPEPRADPAIDRHSAPSSTTSITNKQYSTTQNPERTQARGRHAE